MPIDGQQGFPDEPEPVPEPRHPRRRRHDRGDGLPDHPLNLLAAGDIGWDDDDWDRFHAAQDAAAFTNAAYRRLTPTQRAALDAVLGGPPGDSDDTSP